MLAHLARQVGQNLVPFTYSYLEGSVSHAFNYGSINRDHIFSWNDFTSFMLWWRISNPTHIISFLNRLRGTMCEMFNALLDSL